MDLNSTESAFLKLESDKNIARSWYYRLGWSINDPKKALEIVDQTLRDIYYSNIPFGDKLIVLGGDFRKILPFLKHGYRDSCWGVVL